MSSTPVFLLVDGHSVIFAWPELRALHQRNTRQARETLIQQMRQFHDVSPWKVTLVFDGRQGSTPPRNKGDMVVIYSQKGETADSIIERLVGTTGQARRIQVVTADGAERETIESLGAYAVTPDWLLDEMQRQNTNFSREIEDVHRRAKW